MAFIAASLGLMLLGRVDPLRIEAMRTHAMDALAPILEVLSRPAASAAQALEMVADISNVYEENQRLKAENAKLLQWRQVASKLEAENGNLRNLLRYEPDPKSTNVAARVIASPGGSFVRTLLVTAGSRRGVHKGQAAMTGAGLVGRVIEAGDWTARVLLITDINTRIPVMLEGSRSRAVLAGDNSDQPRLLYLPSESQVSVGERVVTSGHGGFLPPGVPVGVVASVSERGVKVQPYAEMSRIDYLRLVDFQIEPGSGEAMASANHP
jgi:rod shape-determining protein MreC